MGTPVHGNRSLWQVTVSSGDPDPCSPPLPTSPEASAAVRSTHPSHFWCFHYSQSALHRFLHAPRSPRSMADLSSTPAAGGVSTPSTATHESVPQVTPSGQGEGRSLTGAFEAAATFSTGTEAAEDGDTTEAFSDAACAQALDDLAVANAALAASFGALYKITAKYKIALDEFKKQEVPLQYDMAVKAFEAAALLVEERTSACASEHEVDLPYTTTRLTE